MAFVVDASVVAACLLPDEDGTIADEALSRLETHDAFVPDFSRTSCATYCFWPNAESVFLQTTSLQFACVLPACR